MEQDPLILSIETATIGGSLALTRGRELLAEALGDSGVSHSNSLLSDIDRLLKSAQSSLQQIDLFAVASGPGSFTGLRIGLATVKGLAATLDRPCVGVPTLSAIALAAGESPASVALLPAGRGEVFAQMFAVGADGTVSALDDASHIPPAELLEKYREQEQLLWCGVGAHQHWQLIKAASNGSSHWTLAPQAENLARYCGLLGLARLKARQLDLPDSLRAIYVRPSDAELKV